jgi:hypothetical protein
VFWLKNHYTRTNLPTEQLCLQKQLALFQVTHRLEKSLNHKEITFGAFIDIEGAFNNTSFHAITMAAREWGLRRPVAGGSAPCSKAD